MDKLVLLLIFLGVKSIYLPLNRRKSKYYWKIKFDDSIPLIPVFIIPYLGYFFLIAASIILLWNTEYIHNFLISYIISYIIAGVFWYFVPNGVYRPIIKTQDIFSKLTRFIYKHDDDTNGFPSAHVFCSLICAYFLFMAYPQFTWYTVISSLLIIVSTLFVKQHYILDIIGGIIVAYLSVIITLALW